MKKKKLVDLSTEKIRNVTVSDLDAILTIENNCYAQPWSYRMLAQELDNPVANFICSIENGKICGYLCYWYVAGEVEILNIATALHMQRRGIAGKLLEYAFGQVDQNQLTAAFLEVRSSNSGAIALYEKVGFRKTGLRKNYYRDGEDAILMARAFNSVV